MERLKKVLMAPNIGAGYLYFYIHFITEVVCFYLLTTIFNQSSFIWLLALFYDALAFVPQSLIGYFSDKHPHIPLGIIGTILLTLSLLLCPFNINKYIIIGILCLGNCCLHINGAEVTIRSSNGKLSSSAIFVAGGSFGVITGKLLATTNISIYLIALLSITMLPFIILAEEYRFKTNPENTCSNYNYNSLKLSSSLIIILTLIIIITRGYMGYGIPTSWNKTTFETIMLYCAMGLGKALGGIISDLTSARKTAIISTIIALPFLCLGDNNMLISLIGVTAFSMTMSITLGLLVSVLKNTPGLAFGLTTIGLFLGTLPIYFIKLTTTLTNIIIITVLSLICFFISLIVLRSEPICKT